MPDILHKVGVKASPAETYKALTAREQLAGWWTKDTQGVFDVGGAIAFRFGTRGRIDVKVLELDRERRVAWQVVDGPGAWIGSRINFELKPEGDATIVLFKHEGWKEPSEFMHHCSTKWATFLLSLKSLVETGTGAPYPDDVHVSVHGD